MKFSYVLEDAVLAELSTLDTRLAGGHKQRRLTSISLLLVAVGQITIMLSSIYLALIHIAGWMLVLALIMLWGGIVARWPKSDQRNELNLAEDRRSGQVCITDDGIVWQCRDGMEIEIEWAGFAGWCKTDQAIFLIDIRGQGHIIPFVERNMDEQVFGTLSRKLTESGARILKTRSAPAPSPPPHR